ncbi:hypothetical protein J2X13_003200 [Aminobacter aminovorans]|nr:hypothetical protein [Aminobacter aminovorans]
MSSTPGYAHTCSNSYFRRCARFLLAERPLRGRFGDYIDVRNNTAGSLSEAIVIQFALIQATIP